MTDRDYYTPKHHELTPSMGQFKTPLPYNTPKSYDSNRELFATPVGGEKTESDESTASTGTAASLDNNGELTIVAEFDDLMRCVKHRRCGEVEDAFLELAEQLKELQMQWQVAVQECQRLRAALDEKTQDCSDLESKLKFARTLLDKEKRQTRRAEEEKEQLEEHLQQVRNLLLKDKHSYIPDETKEKLSFLHTSRPSYSEAGNGVGVRPQLSAIQEVNTTGSLLSDLSYSRSEDDLDTSTMQGAKNWKKHRPSTDFVEPAPKKRKSTDAKVVEISTSDTVRATTTLTVPKEGPITATSVIESIPAEIGSQAKSPGREDRYHPSAPPAETSHNFWQNDENLNGKTPSKRLHIFQMKTVVMPETCTVCEKRVGFGKSVVKCAVCRTICHVECKSRVPLPCIPVVNTPTVQKGSVVLGYIGDYTPTEPPMVPSLIVHCVNEIERRGLSEVGLYRVPGAEKEVRSLRDRFLKQRGAPCLEEVDVNVLCGTVKDFLRSLNEPLIPRALWRDFVHAAECKGDDRTQRLYEVVADLPQPNRDTLAFMVVHLQKIAESKACRMPIENLAKCFAPTIVGYSAEILPDHAVLSETAQQAQVMEYLLRLPAGYWKSFVHVQQSHGTGKLQQTPSTDSLLRVRGAGGGSLFGSPSSKQSGRKRQKFFPTPPTKK